MKTLFLAVALLAPAQKDPASTKEAMKPIQLLVGEWKSQVEPEDGSGAWEETHKWEYKIEKDSFALEAIILEGKKYKSGVLSYDLKKKLYRFEAVKLDGKTTTFEGKLTGKELSLDEVVPGEASTQERFLFNLLRDNRILMNVEKREGGKKTWLTTHSYAATKQGVPFARAEGPKCVVTGGSPQSEVSYKGKTYYVC